MNCVLRRISRPLVSVTGGLIVSLLLGGTARAQSPPAENPPAVNNLDEAERLAEEALATTPAPPKQQPSSDKAAASSYMPSLLELFILGGWFMAPIAVMSLLALVFSIERALAIRRTKLLPPDLVAVLGEASQKDGGLDPRKVYKACQQFPSAAASVIRSAMLKVGRPHSEVEQTVKDALDREAEKVFKNVRPIILATNVSPLLGLLGTVWGLVDCFARMASGIVESNRAAVLSSGIYTALMTTVFGLCVAIPGSIVAHWLEGKIQSNFREIEELMLNILPQMERFEGKLRVARKGAEAPPERPTEERGKQQVALD